MRKYLFRLLIGAITLFGFLLPIAKLSPRVGATPPGAPDDPIPTLSAEYNQESNTMALTWTNPVEFNPAITGYHISWSLKSQGNWSTPVSITIANATSYNVEQSHGLQPHRAYDFRISVYNGAGESSYTTADGVLFGPHVYSITTCDELQDMNDDLQGSYTLANNIDCSSTDYWTDGFLPIGGVGLGSDSFTGNFDGKGHTITNLYTDHSDDDLAGLFGAVASDEDGSVIKDFTLDGCQVYGNNFTGAVAAVVFGQVTISDVTTYCLVSGSNSQNSVPFVGVGGLVGATMADASTAVTITRSSSDGTVAVSVHDAGTFNLGGGLIGLMLDSTVLSNSYSNSLIVSGSGGDDSLMLGGAVGAATLFSTGNNPIINNVYATGNILLNVGNLPGNLVAFVDHATITNSFSTGDIVYEGDLFSGFFIGTLVDSGSDVTMSNNYTDAKGSNISGCIIDLDDSNDGCTAVNTESQPDTNYFLGNKLNEPMHSWDFDHIWETLDGSPPVLDYRPAQSSDGGSGDTKGKGSENLKKKLATAKLSIFKEIKKSTNIKLDNFSDYSDGTGHKLSGLMVGQIISFDVKVAGKTEHHSITIKKIGDGYIVVTVASKPFDVTLNLNQPQTITINGQNVMNTELTAINGASAELSFAKVLATDTYTPTKTITRSAEVTSKAHHNNVLPTLLLLTLAVNAAYIIRRYKKSEKAKHKL